MEEAEEGTQAPPPPPVAGPSGSRSRSRSPIERHFRSPTWEMEKMKRNIEKLNKEVEDFQTVTRDVLDSNFRCSLCFNGYGKCPPPLRYCVNEHILCNNCYTVSLFFACNYVKFFTLVFLLSNHRRLFSRKGSTTCLYWLCAPAAGSEVR